MDTATFERVEGRGSRVEQRPPRSSIKIFPVLVNAPPVARVEGVDSARPARPTSTVFNFHPKGRWPS
jgi:hypothetical protein